VPAKKDPNREKLELRLLFFSSLILSPSEKPLHGVSITLPRGRQLRFEYRLKVARIAASN
jgi:hypothetical protein